MPGMNAKVWILILTIFWAAPWKVYAVWYAVKNKDKKWFVALVILNTLAVLEIFYIFFVLNKTIEEVKADFQRWTSSVKK